MKIRNQFLTGLLTAAMALTMTIGLNTTVFAANQDPLPTATITASKIFNADAPVNNSKITEAKFTLTSVGYTGEVTGTTVPMPAATVKTAALTASGNSASGSTVFDAIPYSVPGIYTYKLVETVDTAVPGVTYDTAERFVNVYVTNLLDANNQLILNDNGTPQVEVKAITVYKETNGTLNWNSIGNENAGNPDAKTGETGTITGINGTVTVGFTNTFGDTAGNTVLSVSKTVTGALGNPDTEFEFTLTTDSTNSLAYQVFDAAGAAVTSGTGKSGAIVSGGSFFLKHGETARIYNLAGGNKYTVTEKSSTTANGYKTSISGTAAGTAITAVTDITDGAKTAGEQTFALNAIDRQAFVNNKGVTPPTGITMEVLPFALMFILAGCAVIVMIIRKRRVS
ncbi:MAG: DUF5979 domain-containing protein [Lachnospiraceae bacterium]|jgi:hypothetical protein|nr:DUF5979 domain-containing protein [Lachnospiraceae bacterium]